jgi:hypothetical protein
LLDTTPHVARVIRSMPVLDRCRRVTQTEALVGLVPRAPRSLRICWSLVRRSFGADGYESTPNIFGGVTYRLSDGREIETRPNVFGGRGIRYPDGSRLSCTANVFGGEDCRP